MAIPRMAKPLLLAAVVALFAAWTHAECPDLCLPGIDMNYTEIRPVVGFRGSAKIIPVYKGCHHEAGNFHWEVKWNDEVMSSGNLTALDPVSAEFSYQQRGVFHVVAAYCSFVPSSPCCRRCSYVSKSINVTE